LRKERGLQIKEEGLKGGSQPLSPGKGLKAKKGDYWGPLSPLGGENSWREYSRKIVGTKGVKDTIKRYEKKCLRPSGISHPGVSRQTPN